MTKLCLLLAAACVPLIHSAAVLDLINLFHQYEDDILGRGQGVNPEPLEIEEETEAGVIRKLHINIIMDHLIDQKFHLGKPIEVHGWDGNLKVGQVSAVDVNQDNDPVIFQRGPVVWDASSFGLNNVLNTK